MSLAVHLIEMSIAYLQMTVKCAIFFSLQCTQYTNERMYTFVYVHCKAESGDGSK